MHGRRRPPKNFEPPAEVIAALERKTKLLKNATTEVLNRRKDNDYGEEGLVLSAKLLALNPEVYTAWNYRREAVSKVLNNSEASVDDKCAASDRELQVSAVALKRNPKSYSAWHQRQWVLSKGYCVPEREFLFVEEKLEEDERNFHAWNYRQFLAGFAGHSPEEELEFSQKKIEQNFGNFSAWHYRTKFLPLVCQKSKSVTLSDLVENKPGQTWRCEAHMNIPQDILNHEYSTLHSAFATDTEDSSAWFYFRWLLTQSLTVWEKSPEAKGKEMALKNLLEITHREQEWLKNELLPLNPDSKWPNAAIMWIQEIRNQCKQDVNCSPDSDRGTEFLRLVELDSQRGGFYTDLKSGQASIVIGLERT